MYSSTQLGKIVENILIDKYDVAGFDSDGFFAKASPIAEYGDPADLPANGNFVANFRQGTGITTSYGNNPVTCFFPGTTNRKIYVEAQEDPNSHVNYVNHVIFYQNANACYSRTVDDNDDIVDGTWHDFMGSSDSSYDGWFAVGDLGYDMPVYGQWVNDPAELLFTIKAHGAGIILPDGTEILADDIDIDGDIVTLDVLEAAFARYDQNVPLPDMSAYPSFATVNAACATEAEVQALIQEVISERSA